MNNKTLFLSLAASLLIGFGACKKDKNDDGKDDKKEEVKKPGDDIKQQQNSLVVEPTATWCGPCGQSGKPATDLALGEYPKAIGIYAHLNAPASDLGSQCGQDLAYLYGAATPGGGYSIPKIAVGNNITGAYTDVNYTAKIIKDWIAATLALTSKVNTKIEPVLTGTELKVKTTTKFFEAGEADNNYKISVLLVEDKISNRQKVGGTYEILEHHNVARKTISAATSGDDLIGAGVPTSGQVITKDFTVNVDASWKKENMKVITIIWKQKGTNLTFINADVVNL